MTSQLPQDHKVPDEDKVDVELAGDQARQGKELRAMRYVLGISLGIAVVAMVIVAILYA